MNEESSNAPKATIKDFDVDSKGMEQKSWDNGSRAAYEDHCGTIQTRAKHNALAHRHAGQQARCKADFLFLVALFTTIAALFFTTAAYIVDSEDARNFLEHRLTKHKSEKERLDSTSNAFEVLPPKDSFAVTPTSLLRCNEVEECKKQISNTVSTYKLWFTLISIVSSFLAVLSQSIASHKKYDTQAMLHDEVQQAFNHMSQRARDILNPGLKRERAPIIVESLEREFALLKSRGPEPLDGDFVYAHQVDFERKKQGAKKSFVPPESASGGQNDSSLEFNSLDFCCGCFLVERVFRIAVSPFEVIFRYAKSLAQRAGN